MHPDKRKFKLAQVAITSQYSKSGDECYVVTELWKAREFGDFAADWEYKYQAQTLERASELAKMRIAKYGN